MTKNKKYFPDWYQDIPHKKSYRSIFKWGSLKEFKHPNFRLYELMRDSFGMSDKDFEVINDLGVEKVEYNIPIIMGLNHIKAFERIVGSQNVFRDDYSRLSTSYGKTMYDILRLRKKIVENLPELVIHPRNKSDVIEIVDYCDKHKIPLYIYGGGSSVTRGTECIKGGITLKISTHMNKVVEINDINQTVTCQPGIIGKELEKILNRAMENFDSKRNYTCGHFPQSFEYSTVGGWVVTRGAGQNSTYYGKIEDIVLSQEYITPVGTIKTRDIPAKATGPDIDHIMMGSEGAFGVLVSVTLKIFRYSPRTRKRFSYVFKNWDSALNAFREVMQSECGFPSVFRLSDPEETDIGLKLYGIEDSAVDKVMKIKGYKPGDRCLLLGSADGDKKYTKTVAKNVKKICKRYGAMNSTAHAVKMWEHGRFKDPYLREDLQDFGIIIDTLECAINWSQLTRVYEMVRGYIKGRPETIAMTHISHSYAQGCNLYFIFIAKMAYEEYLLFYNGLLDTIEASGAAMSHHHGIGKSLAPWFVKSIGDEHLAILKTIKNHFDPNNIMNPGGTLGFDLGEEK
jgi:alkyldihydroxyacetonephosphate synthase